MPSLGRALKEQGIWLPLLKEASSNLWTYLHQHVRKLTAPGIWGSHLAVTKGSRFLARCKAAGPSMLLERHWIEAALNQAYSETFQYPS